MKAYARFLLGVLLLPARLLADPPVIGSFHGNGVLTWTNALTTDAIYRVEWNTDLTSGWQRSWQDLSMIEGRTNTTFTAAVPMFYRVSMATQAPPAGMVLVDAGAYRMGDPYDEGGTDERPVHTISVGAFWMDRNEVSKALWTNVFQWATNNGYSFGLVAFGTTTPRDHPVQPVSWYDAVKWCNARSQREGLSPVYYTDAAQTSLYRSGTLDIGGDCADWTANGYRLPTEAEWEKAARGGWDGHHYPWFSYGGDWSNHIDGTHANYWGSGDPYEPLALPRTTPIAYYNGAQLITNGGGQPLEGHDMANTYGLYDMAGNSWEWCWDWYDSGWYTNNLATESDSHGPDNPNEWSQRVVRGGSWTYFAQDLRCAKRFRNHPSYIELDDGVTGFRCVRRY